MITFEKTRTVLDLVVFQEDKELNAHGSCFFILPYHISRVRRAPCHAGHLA